jgi:hypothetical protein
MSLSLALRFLRIPFTGNHLCTEKLLAFIIHATLKLAYSPYPPFFLIDEVALSLDETRKKAVFNYPLHLAKENGS